MNSKLTVLGRLWYFLPSGLQPTEPKCTTSIWESLAVCLAVQYFRQALRVAHSIAHRAQAACTRAGCSLRPVTSARRSSLIHCFTVHCGYTSCLWTNNSVADAILCKKLLGLSPTPSIHLDTMAQTQVTKPDIDQLQRDSSLNFAVAPIRPSRNTAICYLSLGRPGPMVSGLLAVHYPTDPVKLVTERFA